MRSDKNPKFISPLGPSHLPWSEGKPSKQLGCLEGPSLHQPPQNSSLSQQSTPSFKQTIKEGFGIGLGASVGRNIVDRIFSSSTPTVTSPTVTSPTVASPTVASPTLPESKRCLPEKQSFDTCIKENRDIKMCELTMKVYHDCLDSFIINAMP